MNAIPQKLSRRRLEAALSAIVRGTDEWEAELSDLTDFGARPDNPEAARLREKIRAAEEARSILSRRLNP